MAACAPIPHIFIYPIRNFLGLLVGKRARQRPPEIIQDGLVEIGLAKQGLLVALVFNVVDKDILWSNRTLRSYGGKTRY